MSAAILVVDIPALLAMILGLLMLFRQALLRKWWAAATGKQPENPQQRRRK